MSSSSQSRYLQRLKEDFRHFLHRPGLIGITAVLLILIGVFIVYPIGAVLIKSFTVSYPTTRITCHIEPAVSANDEQQLLQPLLKVLKQIEGLESLRVVPAGTTCDFVLRFEKHWDDLKGLNDAKRAVARIQPEIATRVTRITYRLGSETIRSVGTYLDFFSHSQYYRALRNSIILAFSATGSVIVIAFCFAYLGLKGPFIVRAAVRMLGLLPLVAPPFIFALALILIGGRMGLLTQLFNLPFNLYGWPGVLTAQVITFLPLGYLMIENVLRSIGTNLEDAARDLRAGDVAVLARITIPLAAPGILKAGLLVFLMSIADFGNPMLIGGGVSFLATDAYFLWISENDLEMAAVFCVFLVLPSLIMFVIHEYILKGRVYTTIGGKPQQTEKRRISPRILFPMLGIVSPVAAMILLCFGMIFVGAFTKIVMVDNSLTIEHFSSPNGFRTLMTSLKFAFSAALIAPIIGVTLSYLLVRRRIPFKQAVEFLALLGFAVPGTVMGVGYIIAFNAPPLKLTGTFLIMIINEAFRNLSVSLEAGTSKLHQIDVGIEEAAQDMGAGALRLFTRIVLPLISSALVAGFVYTFMVGMIAVSAVIFLISPGNNLASLYILAVAEEGFLGMACAISVMLILVVAFCLGALKLVAKTTRTQIF